MHEDRIKNLVNENLKLKKELAQNNKKIRDLENYSRKKNIILDGVKESTRESHNDLIKKVQAVFDVMELPNKD